MSKRAGFTLVELMVALMIFGLLAAAAVALLGFSVRAQDLADGRNEALAALRRTSSLMTADFAQAVPRLSRDEAGAVRPAFETGGDMLVGVVRRGWSNPDGAARPAIQKVRWRLAGGRLERIAHAYVDGAAAMPPVALLDGVESARLRFRDAGGSWRDRWDPTDPTRLPRVVELVLAVRGQGEVRQLFLVGP